MMRLQKLRSIRFKNTINEKKMEQRDAYFEN